ncbi:MAG: C_GCAxxG_C_C family protein [Oscillospiraceae bacterium]|jgi:C_GCAxxG_C_C family probable redox protein|nr:C_GCAxxG_C_C family protein [Oscillospiraceae bacterium]
MSVEEKAIAYHDRGFNCAQSVLCSVGAYTGLDENTALAVAAGFGGGCRCGEICGAVSGAIMALGMHCPYVDGRDLERKEEIAALSRFLTGRFREEFGALRCDEIKGDKAHCPDYIRFMAKLAEDTIIERNNQKTGE